ncbi:hypothetical protein AW40_26600 [Kosakonia radicincitans UMEnt01/12]|uniref:hypothetical protein n=1 Tax=Kosakonia radicincitans TaxID=283686 RepID=UPI000460D114|nr:hypothetical protein [Kosakonia radicincitans]KDE33661.1 hypothetical protein AW40_26600 [Kosakonia radicincitans UMEnt01/12]
MSKKQRKPKKLDQREILDTFSKKIKISMPKFEIVENCIRENKVRADILYKVAEGLKPDKKHRKYLRLAKKLDNCLPDSPCGSMACSLCQRTRRLKFMQKWLPYIKKHQDEYVAVTVVSYVDMLPNKKLFGWKYDALKERVRKAISRIGFSGPVIGGFEMDYHNYTHDPDVSHWMPHHHLLVPNEPEKIDRLRQYMLRDKNLHARDGRKNRPLKVGRIDDPVRALSYCISGMWMEHVWFRNEKGEVKKRRKPGRIRDERVFAKSLVKLDRMSDGQLTFGVNVQALRKKI